MSLGAGVSVSWRGLGYGTKTNEPDSLFSGDQIRPMENTKKKKSPETVMNSEIIQ